MGGQVVLQWADGFVELCAVVALPFIAHTHACRQRADTRTGGHGTFSTCVRCQKDGSCRYTRTCILRIFHLLFICFCLPNPIERLFSPFQALGWHVLLSWGLHRKFPLCLDTFSR